MTLSPLSKIRPTLLSDLLSSDQVYAYPILSSLRPVRLVLVSPPQLE